MKKIIIGMLTVFLCLYSSVISFAADINHEKDSIVGLSYEMPYATKDTNGIIPYGTEWPDRKGFYTNNIAQDVRGKAEVSQLYTNKCFTGIVKLEYNMNNYHSATLTQQLRQYTFIGSKSIEKRNIVRGGAGSTYHDLSADKVYFVEYSAPSDFKGTLTGKTK